MLGFMLTIDGEVVLKTLIAKNMINLIENKIKSQYKHSIGWNEGVDAAINESRKVMHWCSTHDIGQVYTHELFQIEIINIPYEEDVI